MPFYHLLPLKSLKQEQIPGSPQVYVQESLETRLRESERGRKVEEETKIDVASFPGPTYLSVVFHLQMGELGNEA